MPATSREPPGDLPVLVNPTGGSSRRERVSARHQVNRPERRFRKSLLPNGDPAEERFFDGHVLRSVWTTGPRIHGRSSLRWILRLTCSPTPSFSFCRPVASARLQARPISQITHSRSLTRATVGAWSFGSQRFAATPRSRLEGRFLDGCAIRKSSSSRTRGSITPDGRGDGVTVRQRSGSLPASWATRRIGSRVRGDDADVAATRARCGVILSHPVEGRARRSASRRRLRGWLSFPQAPR